MPESVPFPPDLDLVESILANLSFALSASTSYFWNRRNLESPWYGYWNQLLVLLFAAIPGVVVVPQDELWPYRCGKKKEHRSKDVLDGLAKGDSPLESSDSETEDEDVIDNEDDLDGAYEADDFNVDLDGGDDDRDDSGGSNNNDIGCAAEASGFKDTTYEVSTIAPGQTEADRDILKTADVTTASTQTVPAKPTTYRRPDFTVLCHDTAELPPQHPRRRQRGGLRIPSQRIAVVIEIKRNIRRVHDRDLFSPSIKEERAKEFSTACIQSFRQCALAFAKYEECQEVIAIAVVGPFWMHATVTRSQTKPTDTKFRSIDGYEHVNWSNPVACIAGSEMNVHRLDKLRRYVASVARAVSFSPSFLFHQLNGGQGETAHKEGVV